jgi:hypothetical protein
MVVVVDLDGDGDVEVDATVDGPSIFASMATTPSARFRTTDSAARVS